MQQCLSQVAWFCSEFLLENQQINGSRNQQINRLVENQQIIGNRPEIYIHKSFEEIDTMNAEKDNSGYYLFNKIYIISSKPL